MPNILKEVRLLQEEGKLHKRLISRVRILFIISLILGGFVAYSLIFKGLDPLITSILALTGFLLGMFVFSRMSVVNWNEEETVIQTGQMDTVGFITIGLYILFEIALRTFLKDFYPLYYTPFLYAGIFGTLFGRAVGTVIEIHKVFRSTHASNNPQS